MAQRQSLPIWRRQFSQPGNMARRHYYIGSIRIEAESPESAAFGNGGTMSERQKEHSRNIPSFLEGLQGG